MAGTPQTLHIHIDAMICAFDWSSIAGWVCNADLSGIQGDIWIEVDGSLQASISPFFRLDLKEAGIADGRAGFHLVFRTRDWSGWARPHSILIRCENNLLGERHDIAAQPQSYAALGMIDVVEGFGVSGWLLDANRRPAALFSDGDWICSVIPNAKRPDVHFHVCDDAVLVGFTAWSRRLDAILSRVSSGVIDYLTLELVSGGEVLDRRTVSSMDGLLFKLSCLPYEIKRPLMSSDFALMKLATIIG